MIHICINTHLHNSVFLLYYNNDQLENIILKKKLLSSRITKTVDYLEINQTRDCTWLDEENTKTLLNDLKDDLDE